MTIADTFPNGLRVPQLEGALRIFTERRILLADQPGAGKTAQALVGLEMDRAFEGGHRYNTLILCNVTGCQLTWAGELRNRVLAQYPDVVLADLTDTEGRKTMPTVAKREERLAGALLDAEDQGAPLIVLANYDLVRWPFGKVPKVPTLWDITWDAIIVDESHLVLPTQEDEGRKITQFLHGLYNLPLNAEPIKLSMTGTPDRGGKLWNRYGHWKFLRPAGYRNFWAWAKESFVVDFVERGWDPRRKQPFLVPEIGKLRNEHDWDLVSRQWMIRRTKAEMLKGLPDKQWAGDGGIDLPMTPTQEHAYWEYQSYMEDRELELRAQERFGEADALKLQFALRSRQMATCQWEYTESLGDDGKIHTTGKPLVLGPEHSNKLAWILDWLDARGHLPDGYDATLGKVVIVSQFTEVLGWLQAELAAAGVEAQILSGDTPAPQKVAIEQRFQHGDLRVVLLSITLGVSINLDAADDMIFIDSVHSPDTMEQAEDRIHRASRMHQVTYWRLASINTGDMVVLQTIDTRYRETRARYDGARGVEFARRMLGMEPGGKAA